MSPLAAPCAPPLTHTRAGRYQTIADSADTKGIAPPRTWTVPDIERWLLAHAASLQPHQALSPVKSVFEQGFDRCAPCVRAPVR